MRLLISMVRAAHHRTRCCVQESHLASFFRIHLERVWMYIAAHWQVATGRLQVLTNGQHGNSVGAQVAQDLQNFLIGLAQPDHEAGFGRYRGMHGLEALQQV